MAAIGTMIAAGTSYTEDLKFTLLSILLAVYLGMVGGFLQLMFRTERYPIKLPFGAKVYGIKFLRIGRSKTVRTCILWNLGFCYMACIGALVSLIIYQRDCIDFIISLWVSEIRSNIQRSFF